MLGVEFMETSTRVLCAAGYARTDLKQEQERLPDCRYRLINLRGSADDCTYTNRQLLVSRRIERV